VRISGEGLVAAAYGHRRFIEIYHTSTIHAVAATRHAATLGTISGPAG
jgi:hypothetical protein